MFKNVMRTTCVACVSACCVAALSVEIEVRHEQLPVPDPGGREPVDDEEPVEILLFDPNQIASVPMGSYSCLDVLLGDIDWYVTEVTTYFENTYDWSHVSLARLTLYERDGGLPGPNDDPRQAELVDVTVDDTGQYNEVTAAGLHIPLFAAEHDQYWIGLTPIVGPGVGWNRHVPADQVGDNTAWRNPGGGLEEETDWIYVHQREGWENWFDTADAAILIWGYPQAVSDACEEALQIGDGDTRFSTVSMTTDGPAHPVDCQFDGQTYHDIWYTYVATCTGDLTVSTCNQADYDTDLVVYETCDCNDLVWLGCNDDAVNCAGYTSEVTVPVVEGNCYLIRVGGYAQGSQGTGTLTIQCGRPANDDCQDALPMTDGVVGFSNIGATTDGPDEPDDCNEFEYSQIDSDIWYRYTATRDGEVIVSSCGSLYDTKIAVYGPDCPIGPGEVIACNDDYCGLQSRIVFTAAAGADYLIRIGGWLGYQGDGMLTIWPVGILGDIDGDGDVDLADLATLLGAYGRCIGDPAYNPGADLDGSGCVDLSDLAALLGNYGSGT